MEAKDSLFARWITNLNKATDPGRKAEVEELLGRLPGVPWPLVEARTHGYGRTGLRSPCWTSGGWQWAGITWRMTGRSWQDKAMRVECQQGGEVGTTSCRQQRGPDTSFEDNIIYGILITSGSKTPSYGDSDVTALLLLMKFH